MSSRRPPRTSEEVREAFIDFFKSKGHVERPSSSLVPAAADPTVLLTTAGVQQMIPYILGRARPPAPRMVSVQKCFRTTDIDQVGNPRNLTFFEMMGNFSLGDYFKPEAVAWGWEFVAEWLKVPAEAVWITVHPSDDEAVELWQGQGIPEARIIALDDNWWGPPGAEGPCGPDSELYFDRGEALGCGRASCAPGCECDRFLEFWNLVFMQYYQDRAGERTPLPRPNIDTGMGLERTTSLMQGASSVYETDLFRPIIDTLAEQAGTHYGRDQKVDYALRVVADHGRGMTFLAGDGVAPSNEGRGYVLRRIIRRAVRYGRVLGIDRPFLATVVETVIARMAARYPELSAQKEAIRSIVTLEAHRFRETLTAGESRLASWMEEARAGGQAIIDGRRLFLLYDTYGYPLELSEEMLAEEGLGVDQAGFEQAMAEQRERSRGLGAAGRVAAGGIDATIPRTEFVGYDVLEMEAELLRVQAEGAALSELREGRQGLLILDRTPFYPEGGGQVGDQGVIILPSGIFQVEDSQEDDAGRVLHRGRMIEGAARPGAGVWARVDRLRRQETTRHHTLTHLLHQSLRDILGANTHQRGSLVAPGVARFDFNCPGPLSQMQRRDVQDRINGSVLADLAVEWRVMLLEEARESGALMIFGEKYGDHVRVVRIGDFSRELCGGTHVGHSSEVGTAVILRETGIGSGLRRVEVVAGRAGLDAIYRRLEDVQEISRRLGVPTDDARRKVDEVLDQLEEAKREMARLVAQLAARQAGELAQQVRVVHGVRVLATRVNDLTAQGLVERWDALRDQLKSVVVFLGGVTDQPDRTVLLVGVTEDLWDRGLDAGVIMRRFAQLAGGKGGGNRALAKGAGRTGEQLDAALAAAPSLVQKALEQGS